MPGTWTPDQLLPVLITLRTGPSINNNHRPPNSLVTEARKRGYFVISPLGYRGLAQPDYGDRYPVIRPICPFQPAAVWAEEDHSRSHAHVFCVLGLVTEKYTADLNCGFIYSQNLSGSAAL